MGNVKGKYIKDENGTIFSPIVSTDTAFDANGVSITDNIGDIGSILDSLNGTSVTDTLQSNKAVTILENGVTTITPDSGYDGMSRVVVTVDAAGEMQTKSQTITSNTTTTITPDSGYDGMTSVSVTTNVKNNRLLAVIYGHTCASTSTVTDTVVYYDSTYFSSASNKLTAKSAFSVNYYFRKTTNGTTAGKHTATAYIGSTTVNHNQGGNQQSNNTKALSSGNTVYATCYSDNPSYQTANVLFLYLV